MQNQYFPFLQWVGGKRQLLNQIVQTMPKSFNNYYEPFLGGGALFFNLGLTKEHQVFVSDINDELINSYQQLKNNPKALINSLNNLYLSDSKQMFYQIRSLDRLPYFDQMPDLEKAIRFIYLNHAGFNGLWRVNQKNQCNTPYGSHKRLTLNKDLFFKDSQYLNQDNIHISQKSFTDALQNVKPHDFVYLDPPYIPLNNTSYFTSYNSHGFSFQDQIELRDLALHLSARHVFLLISNSDTPACRSLYADDIFRIRRVQASRSINSNAKKRGKINELLISNY